MIEMEARDIQASYCGSYLGWDAGSGIVPMYVDAVSDDTSLTNPKVLVRKKDAGRRSTIELNDERVVLEYPDIGNIVLDGTPYYLQRKARRQWVRGIRTETVAVYSLTADNARRAVRCPNWWEAIHYVYNKPFDEYREGTCVLDNNIAVHDTIMYYRGYAIAKLYDETVELAPGCDFLIDYIRGLTNASTTVVQCTS